MSSSPQQRASETLRLNITSDAANLADVRRAVEALSQRCGLNEQSVADVGLCVNEALANVIRHAYGGTAGKPITVEAVGDHRGVEVRIRDWGNGIDPASLPPRAPDPLRPGGLGLICLRKMMDTVRWERQSDGMLLTMFKRREPAPTESASIRSGHRPCPS